MIISKHYPFQKVSDQYFSWKLKNRVSVVSTNRDITVFFSKLMYITQNICDMCDSHGKEIRWVQLYSTDT